LQSIDRSYSWIEDRAKRSHPLNAPISSKVFAMLHAYMDDSGTHPDSHNCVVAGYWASANEWRRFERDWNAVLQREGLKEFKANEFWPRPNGMRIGPYRDWTNARHAKLIDDLLLVIRRWKVIPFGCGVIGAEWNAQPAEFKAVYSRAGCERHAKSMLLPFQRNIYRTASYCHKGISMHFTFDESTQSHVKAAITQCYSELKRSAVGDPLRDCLGDIAFADSDRAAPLQAADLLAYEMHRYAKRTPGIENMRFEYKRALVRMKTNEDFWLFDKARFRNLNALMVETAIG
jgi:hypothetical protein